MSLKDIFDYLWNVDLWTFFSYVMSFIGAILMLIILIAYIDDKLK